MNDPIKLAEAIGLKCSGCQWREVGGKHGREWMAIWGCPVHEFKPFTDANDDYAVLEWLIENAMGTEKEPQELQLPQHQYQIGNNARAALKVIE